VERTAHNSETQTQCFLQKKYCEKALLHLTEEKLNEKPSNKTNYLNFSEETNSNIFTLFPTQVNKKSLRWDNLLYVPVELNHENEVIFRENLLWERKNNSLDNIKKFCFNWLVERFQLYSDLKKRETFEETLFGVKDIGKEELLEEMVREKEIQVLKSEESGKPVTIETIEMYVFSLSRQILEEIHLFEKFDFIGLLNLINQYKYGFNMEGEQAESKAKTGQKKFLNEFFIPIELDINTEDIVIKDYFEFDILNEYQQPEDIASQLVKDLEIPCKYTKKISMNIRRQIRDFLFNSVQGIQQRKERILDLEKNTFQLNTSQNHPTKKSMFGVLTKPNKNSVSKESIPVVINSPLTNMLHTMTETGITNRESKHHKPPFFRNRSNNNFNSLIINNKSLDHIDADNKRFFKHNIEKTVFHDEKRESLYIVKTALKKIENENIITINKDIIEKYAGVGQHIYFDSFERRSSLKKNNKGLAQGQDYDLIIINKNRLLTKSISDNTNNESRSISCHSHSNNLKEDHDKVNGWNHQPKDDLASDLDKEKSSYTENSDSLLKKKRENMKKVVSYSSGSLLENATSYITSSVPNHKVNREERNENLTEIEEEIKKQDSSEDEESEIVLLV